MESLAVGQTASDSFVYRIQDTFGDTDTGTVTITITGVNDVPVLDNSGDMQLTDIAEDDTANTGKLVSDIIASSAVVDPITDVDNLAVEGIAVVGVDDTNGQWQSSVDNGATWNAFGFVSETAATLLDASVRIRFAPNPHYSGPAGNITFRAWDQADGNLSGTTGVDVSTNGGATAYSIAMETATLAVTPVADVPNSTAPSAVTADEDQPVSLGLSAGLVDTDGSETLTVVITGIVEGVTVSTGTESFTGADGADSVDVSTWDLSAITLKAPDQVNFSLTVTATSTEANPTSSDLTVAALTASTLATIDVTVLNTAPNVTVSPDTQTVQYSDPISSITITAADVAADTMNATVSWSTDGVAFEPGLPDALTLADGLTFSGAADQVETGTWTITGIADLDPAQYTVRVRVTDEDGGSTDIDTLINVEGEDALATYSGPVLGATSSINDSQAMVQLRATIQEITGVSPETDPNGGDLTQATVSFVNRDTGAIIAADLPVQLLDPQDPTTAVVTFDWLVDIGSDDSQSFTIGTIVGGFYARDDEADNTVVTVSQPTSDFVTGSGFLVNHGSAGLYAGDDGLHTNFGLTVKFKPSLTDLKGQAHIVVRQAGRVYQINTTTLQSLVVDPVTGQATFIGDATLEDITNRGRSVSLGENLTLIVTLTDVGEPGRSDTIGFTLWNDTELWFSSHWDGTQTLEQALGGGNLQVHDKKLILAGAALPTEAGEGSAALTGEELQPLADAAVARWAAAGIDPHDVQKLKGVDLRVAEFEGSTLGSTFGPTVWIDRDAAGHGWFIDPTPTGDREFRVQSMDGELLATPRSPAFGHMDLLTVVMHEMGHVLGLEDLDHERHGHALMSETLPHGVRRTISGGSGRAGSGADGHDLKLAAKNTDSHVTPRTPPSKRTNSHPEESSFAAVLWDTPYVPVSHADSSGDSPMVRYAMESVQDKNSNGSAIYPGHGELFKMRFKSALSSTPWLRPFLLNLADTEAKKDPNSDLVVTLED